MVLILLGPFWWVFALDFGLSWSQPIVACFHGFWHWISSPIGLGHVGLVSLGVYLRFWVWLVLSCRGLFQWVLALVSRHGWAYFYGYWPWFSSLIGPILLKPILVGISLYLRLNFSQPARANIGGYFTLIFVLVWSLFVRALFVRYLPWFSCLVSIYMSRPISVCICLGFQAWFVATSRGPFGGYLPRFLGFVGSSSSWFMTLFVTYLPWISGLVSPGLSGPVSVCICLWFQVWLVLAQ
jgi:hypothetical protein